MDHSLVYINVYHFIVFWQRLGFVLFMDKAASEMPEPKEVLKERAL